MSLQNTYTSYNINQYIKGHVTNTVHFKVSILKFHRPNNIKVWKLIHIFGIYSNTLIQ